MLALLSAVLGLVAIAASQGGNTVTSVLSGSISGTSRSTPTTGALAPQFTVPASADQGAPVLANLRDPQAVDAQTVCPGYKIDRDSVETTPTGGFTARLVLAGNSCNVYGNDVAVLTLTVAYQAADRLRVSLAPTYVGPANETWFALPEELVPRPSDDGGSIDSSELLFEYSNDPSFTFKVRRKATGDVIFDTTGSKLVFEDQFLEMKTALPTDYNLYGLGEVIHGLRLNRKLNRTLFAADMGDPIDGNIYGNHPVYYETRYFSVDGQTRMLVSSDDVSGNRDRNVTYESYTHAVYLRDAHAHEVLLRNDSLTWRTLGGEIDLYFYSGPTIEAATRAYQLSAAGLPAMQQYWTLGFHQCRWGYRSWAEVAEVVADFKKFDIPLETIWTDIDYMNQYRNFENDAAAFGYAEAAAFLEKLHADEQHYVPIIDAAIYVPNPQNESDAYPTYDRGVAADAFMLNPDGSLYIGAVWPGYTVFPDWIGGVFNGTGAFRWWADELAIWHSRIAFDGAWIDMNEASSFCVGSCGSNNLTLNPVHPPFKLPGEPGAWQLEYPEGFNISNSSDFSSVASWSSSAYAALSTSTGSMPVTTAATSTTMLSSVSASESSPVPASASSTSPSSYLRTVPTPGSRNINYPPYAINNWQGSGDLAVHAVSPNATHHGTQRWQEYDVHNLFGHQMLNATYSALRSLFPAVRPFIIGRSTFVGSGRWAGHWGGDNKSKWSYMFFSIPQALSFSLSGIPIFGVDTCGFSGNTDAELCARWMSLSAFFTFYRNHNILAAIPQEPYRWSSVAAASRNAMAIRYRLLPYMYTLLRNAHTRGDTVMRALAWEFPREPWLAAADRQFLLGPAVLVTPVLVRGATSVNGVFPGVPEEVWYDWYTGSAALSINATRGQNVTIADVPIEKIPVFIRGGYVIPMQEARNTTANCRRSPWSVLVALDRAGTSATGELYLDDGVSVQPEETLSVAFRCDSNVLTTVPTGTYRDANPLAKVTIWGIGGASGTVTAESIRTVSLNGQILPSENWSFDAGARILSVRELQNLTSEGAWKAGWTLTWS